MERKAVFFDLDGTLYNYTFSHQQGMQAAYENWKNHSDDSFRQFKDNYNLGRQWVKRFLADSASVHSRALYFQKMLENIDHKLDTTLILELLDSYWKGALNNLLAYPRVKKTINNLKSRDYLVGIISNMEAAIQYRKLSRLELNKDFDVIVTSDEVGHEKPHPLVFTHALKVLNVSPSRSWMVGDSFYHDVEPASWLGMKAAWFNPEKVKSPDNAKEINYTEIETFEELLDLL